MASSLQHRNAALLRLGRAREHDLEHAVLISRVHFVGVDRLRQGESAPELSAFALAPVIARAFFGSGDRLLAADRELIATRGDLDAVFFEACDFSAEKQ